MNIDLTERYNLAMNNLRTWRQRYDKSEYPSKIVDNMFYRQFAMDDIWESELKGSFFQYKNTESDQFTSDIKIQRIYEASALRLNQSNMLKIRMERYEDVGGLNFKNNIELIKKSQGGDNVVLEELEYTYLYFYLSNVLTQSWASLGRLGYSEIEAISKLTGFIIEPNHDIKYEDILTIFGNCVAGVFLKANYIKLENFYQAKMPSLKYASITNKGECLSTINNNPTFEWTNLEAKVKAGRTEWMKHDFYPANGMVGVIVDEFVNPIWGNIIYVLKIADEFYVPMTEKGLKFIDEDEYKSQRNIDKNEGISSKSSSLHNKEDEFFKKINDGGTNPLNFSLIEKLSVFNVIIELMNVDGKIVTEEILYSIKLMNLLDMNATLIEDSKKLNPIFTVNTIQKMNDLKKSAFKMMMIEMIKSDGVIEIEENELFLSICIACQL